MGKPVDVRTLDEWMYAINTAAADLESVGNSEALALIRATIDDMRERRAHLALQRHNELGY